MKHNWILLACLMPCTAVAQSGVYAYLPAQNSFLKLKDAKVDSTIIGGMVRTVTTFTYEPPPTSSGVSFNFELPATSTLGGFGYFEGDYYIQGHLQVRSRGLQVNSSFGNGLRASGLMDQSSPSVYRCEIWPAGDGADLKIQVWSDGMVTPTGDRVVVPNPSLEIPVQPNTPSWTIRRVSSGPLEAVDDRYLLGVSASMAGVAQKFSDGRFYVAGYIHAKNSRIPPIEIVRAFYEPKSGGPGGREVTRSVSNLVQHKQFSIWASDTTFGDPCPNVAKRLRVIAKIDGSDKTIIVPQNETMNLLSEDGPSMITLNRGLSQPKTVIEDPGTVAFFGWTSHPGLVTASFQGRKFETRLKLVPKGSDAARLWAQQVLATNSIGEPDRVLDFSMKYGILSNVTTLLAATRERQKINFLRTGSDVAPVR